MSEGADPPLPRTRWRDRDHTRGSLLASTLVLALPLLAASSLGGIVFQVVDLAFISRLGDAPMAAVIIVNQTLRQIVFMAIMGLSFGCQALIARAVGERQPGRAEQVAGQLVLIGGALALLVALAGLFLAEPLFALTGASESFRAHGVPYLRLVFVLGAGMVGLQLFSAILGGAGDTTTPLLVMLVQTAVAIAAEWILIFGNLGAPALGVRGVALGIAAGQWVGMGIGLAVLFRGGARVHLRLRHLRPDPDLIARILRLSWPPAVQMGIGVVTTLVYLRLTGFFGESVQTAFTVGQRIAMIVPMVGFPLATACATLVGQALGAGKRRRAWRAVGVGVLVQGAVMWTLAVAVFVLRGDIMAWLSQDAEVVRVGTEYLAYASGSFFFWAFYFVFLRTLQGAGDMLVPMLISIGTALLVSIPLALLLSFVLDLGVQGLWLAFLLTSAANTLATGARLATGGWTRRAVFGGSSR